MRHGEGKCTYGSNGGVFTGNWQSNLPAKGKLVLPDGTSYEGDWKDDQFSGVGTINFANGDNYQGEWRQY